MLPEEAQAGGMPVCAFFFGFGEHSRYICRLIAPDCSRQQAEERAPPETILGKAGAA